MTLTHSAAIPGTTADGEAEEDAVPAASPPTDVAVRAHDVRRRFGDREVLHGLDVEIEPGEFVALLGRSGSGKSTFLRALAGLDDGVTGTIQVPERRAVVFQDARLLPWSNVLDNVVLGLRSDDAAERGRAALAEVGLAEHAGDWPKTLSGGEAQRASLARALVREPDLLLLDEPFGALDALTRIRAQRLVGEVWQRRGCAVLLVTHDVEEAVLLADRVLVMDDGRIAHEQRIDLDRPREITDPRFAALRAGLLERLGVSTAAEAA
jgi:sulfonate transport system ATP-binding protein